VPNRPSFPPRLAIMAAGILAAAAIGLAVGYAREHYIGGFNSVEQFEAVTGFQVASSVPTQDNAESAFATMPLSGFSESIRRLRVAYEQSMDRSKSAIILVTSTAPAEGKSVIALSLARSFASVGQRTLLIDADLRHPSLARMLGLESKTGLSDYLMDDSGTMELVPLPDRDSRLDVIIGGSPIKLASDVLVGSSKFVHAVQIFQEVYEVILIDCAPIGPVVDARIVSKLANEILFVVKFGVTPQRAVLAGLKEMLIGRGPDTLKVALNMRSTGVGGYYGSGPYRDYYQSAA
jgi:succinoglycan biosynthesis transport protein ExoP